MKRRISRWFIVASAALLAGGCGWFDKKSDGGGTMQVGADGNPTRQAYVDATLPSPQAQPPIADVPVPIDFKIDEGKSRNYAVAGARFVDHVYTGRGDKFVLKRFFERYMPMNRWTLSTFIYVQGKVTLDFEKENERCKITIWDGGWFGRSTVSVMLWPNRPAAAKGEATKT